MLVPKSKASLKSALFTHTFFLGLFAAGIVLATSTPAVLAQPNSPKPGSPKRAQLDNLIQALNSKAATTRLAAAVFMSNLAPKARERFSDDADFILQELRNAGPKLAKLVGDPDPQVREAAVTALGKTQAVGSVAAAAFTKALKEGNPELRVKAAEAVGHHVERTVEETRERIFRLGERAAILASFLSDATALCSPLGVALQDKEPRVRLAALQALGQLMEAFTRYADLRPQDMPAEDTSLEKIRQSVVPLAKELSALSPHVTRLLAGPDPAIQRAAAQTLGALANLAREQADASNRGRLLRADLEPQGAEAAAILMNELQKAVAALAQALNDKNTDVQLAALDALEMLNSRAKSATPAVTAALNSPSPFVRWAAARLLAKLDMKDNAAVVKGIAKRLSDTDVDVRLIACQALEKFGPQAAIAVPELGSVIAKGDDSELQLCALRALEVVGPKAKDAIPALAKAAQSSEVRVRREVARMLGTFGAASKPAIPALQKLLSDPDVEVRQAAAEALLKIQGFSIGDK